MLNPKEISVLRHLRNDSRQKFTEIAKKTGMHKLTVSNIENRLKDRGVIKHVAMLDFKKLGFNIKLHIAVSCEHKEGLKAFLMEHPNVNSLSTTKGDYDFIAEAVFRSMKDMHDFYEDMEQFEIVHVQYNHLIDEIKVEEFLN
mgnify:CR=1 FL=1